MRTLHEDSSLTSLRRIKDDRKPSVLIVTELYPNYIQASFIGSFVVEQLRYLRRRYNIVVIATYMPCLLSRRRYPRQPRCELREGIHAYWIANRSWWSVGLLRLFHPVMPHTTEFIHKTLTGRKIRNLARQLHQEYNFSLVHGFETHVGDEAVLIGNELGIPSVFTLCGIYWHHLSTFGGTVMRRTIARLNSADRLISVSQRAADSYYAAGVARDFYVAPFGITPPSDSTPIVVPANVLAFVRDKFVLLTVGWFAPEKRVDLAIETVAQLHERGMNDAVLLIIGSGDREPLLKKIQEDQVMDRVMIVGEVHPEDMTSYYQISDVLVHPSIVEGLSMVCLEAMSHGKPVVCTSNIGLVEFLDPGKDSVVVPPNHSEALSQAVADLYHNTRRRQALGRHAKRKAVSLCSAEQARKIIRIYRQLETTNLHQPTMRGR